MNYTAFDLSDIWTETDADAAVLENNGFPVDYFDLGFSFWRALCSTHELPHIREIDPLKIPVPCLPWIDLVEVENDPRRLKIRLWGTGITETVGSDLTGIYYDEGKMFGAVRRLNAVVSKRQPYFATIPLDWHSDRMKHDCYYCSLGLPFQDDSGSITRILCLLYFHPVSFTPTGERPMANN